MTDLSSTAASILADLLAARPSELSLHDIVIDAGVGTTKLPGDARHRLDCVEELVRAGLVSLVVVDRWCTDGSCMPEVALRPLVTRAQATPTTRVW